MSKVAAGLVQSDVEAWSPESKHTARQEKEKDGVGKKKMTT